LKTININLIGNSAKTSKKAKPQLKIFKNTNFEIKTIAVVTIISSCVILGISAGIWFMIDLSVKRNLSELYNLKIENENLEKDFTKLTLTQKDIQKEKKILELKSLARERLDNLILPWNRILTDIGISIPKELTISKIYASAKTNFLFSSQDQNTEKTILIEGQIDPQKVSQNPLSALSYFVLNINENLPSDTPLYDSIIKSVSLSPTSGIYEFKIEAKIKPLQIFQSEELKPVQKAG